MYKNKSLYDLSDIELAENEAIGPELIGTIEFENDGRYIFQGALILTTERLFVNIEKPDGEIEHHQLKYTDISLVTVENRALSGKIVHFWIGKKIEVSMNVTHDKNLQKFLAFYRKHRARALKYENYIFEEAR
ncbi:PH domain-containing protein [Salinicoccus halitifaciens]|uniref:YokE-like PH domain-containing protein n=1 Tax=Salinicoccus halitifaciens TaxID=1073415 RepID=A0ABV2EDN0_9STAP|nr:PH domain-containing protein [Salinicoccus halitifaciens]MCD2137450.1 PH domain-containing protein [Salinicoccus halitifaciens]